MSACLRSDLSEGGVSFTFFVFFFFFCLPPCWAAGHAREAPYDCISRAYGGHIWGASRALGDRHLPIPGMVLPSGRSSTLRAPLPLRRAMCALGGGPSYYIHILSDASLSPSHPMRPVVRGSAALRVCGRGWGVRFVYVRTPACRIPTCGAAPVALLAQEGVRE